MSASKQAESPHPVERRGFLRVAFGLPGVSPWVVLGGAVLLVTGAWLLTGGRLGGLGWGLLLFGSIAFHVASAWSSLADTSRAEAVLAAALPKGQEGGAAPARAPGSGGVLRRPEFFLHAEQCLERADVRDVPCTLAVLSFRPSAMGQGRELELAPEDTRAAVSVLRELSREHLPIGHLYRLDFSFFLQGVESMAAKRQLESVARAAARRLSTLGLGGESGEYEFELGLATRRAGEAIDLQILYASALANGGAPLPPAVSAARPALEMDRRRALLEHMLADAELSELEQIARDHLVALLAFVEVQGRQFETGVLPRAELERLLEKHLSQVKAGA